MISRCTWSVPKEDVLPRLLFCDLRCSQSCRLPSKACRRCFKVHPMFSPELRGGPQLIAITPMVPLDKSSKISVTSKAGQNALLRSDILLKLPYLSLHSTCSQILLEAPCDYDTFWWCNMIGTHKLHWRQSCSNRKMAQLFRVNPASIRQIDLPSD